MRQSEDTGGLPSAEVCARIAIATAGLSGNTEVHRAIERSGSAAAFVARCWDSQVADIHPMTSSRLRTDGHPARVAHVLEETARLGLAVLTPASPLWPRGLNDLGAGAPVALWIGGDLGPLVDSALAVTGSHAPDRALTRQAIDLVTQASDAGWVIASGTNNGIDRTARLAAHAMGGHSIQIRLTAARPESMSDTTVSENPPTQPVVIASRSRTAALLAAICNRAVVIGGVSGRPEMRTAMAAYALGRPIGVAGDGHEAWADRVNAGRVSGLRDIERLI